MKRERRRQLKNAVLSHIIQTIIGELREWDRLETWLSFDAINENERDIAADMFRMEAKRLYKRVT